MQLQSIVLMAMTASTAFAQTTGYPDLVFDNLEILSIELVDTRYEIGIGYSILNIGTSLIDLAGADSVDPMDNIAIQTYMTFDPGLADPFYASGGSIIENPVILAPNETYEGIFFANTTFIPDPTTIDPDMWIVLDILTSSVPSEITTNNRSIIQVPAPGPLALLCLGSLVGVRRRR